MDRGLVEQASNRGGAQQAGKWVNLACALFGGAHAKRFKEAYLESVADLIPARAYGFYLFRVDRPEPYDMAVSGVPAGFVRKYERVRAHDLVFRSALGSRHPFHSDQLTHQHWAGGPVHELLSEYGIPRCMDCPIISPETGRVIGVLNVARSEADPRFTPDEVTDAGLITRLTGAALGLYLHLRNPEALGRVLEAFWGTAPEPGVLTRREMDVAACVARGLTNRAISEALHLSPNTVKMHLKHIFSKLEVKNRSELTARLLVGTRDPGPCHGRLH